MERMEKAGNSGAAKTATMAVCSTQSCWSYPTFPGKGGVVVNHPQLGFTYSVYHKMILCLHIQGCMLISSCVFPVSFLWDEPVLWDEPDERHRWKSWEPRASNISGDFICTYLHSNILGLTPTWRILGLSCICSTGWTRYQGKLWRPHCDTLKWWLVRVTCIPKSPLFRSANFYHSPRHMVSPSRIDSL